MKNIHESTVAGFGDEWERFDQSELTQTEATTLFEDYFSIFPWSQLPADAIGFDLGCGSGRWAAQVASKLSGGTVHCIDPSSAIEIAKKNLSQLDNCKFHRADVDNMPFEDFSMDFGYSLGVLHHVPDTQAGIRSCVRKLKPGAPFLVYLYYAFDNRPHWFRALWQISDLLRRTISRLNHPARYVISQMIAITIYFPLARIAALLEVIGLNVQHMPLSAYRHRSLYVMRTDALDRFGTQLEQRFTRSEIGTMMAEAGLERISFSDNSPFWCAMGYKRTE